MKAAALTVSLAAAALAAGCATDQPRASSSSDMRLAAHQMPYKSGHGVVQSWMATPNAAAGASGRVNPAPGTGDLRLAIKMDDGSMQYVDTDSRDFPVGTRVELTQDRVIKRP